MINQYSNNHRGQGAPQQHQQQNTKFKDRKLFVPIDIRDSSLNVKRGKTLDTAVTVTMVLVGIAIFIFFMTFSSFQQITGFPFLAVLISYIFFFFVIIYVISSKFIFKIDDKMKARSLEGSETFNLNLGMVWRIRAGGINTRNLTSGECILLNYDGRPAIIFKRINSSVEGNEEGADAIHYKSLQRINDVLVSNTSFITKLNLRYDTSNDSVWDYESRRLYNSNHGDTYVSVMQELINHRYDYTSKYSKVSSNYYVLVFKPNTSLDDINSLYESIRRYTTFSCSGISLVDIKEFQSILSHYYGLESIDLSKMAPAALGNDNIGNSRILDFVDKDGNILIDKLPRLKINDLSIYTRLHPEHLLGIKDKARDRQVSKLEDLDIFNQDYI